MTTKTITPRTEKYVLNPLPSCVPADFARDLARECFDARQEIEKLCRKLAEARQIIVNLKKTIECL
jgi:hypothetical protein